MWFTIDRNKQGVVYNDRGSAMSKPTPKKRRYNLGEVDWTSVESCPHITRRQREILRLYFWERYTQQEIGDRLGISRQRVSAAISSGIESLQVHLQDRE